MQPYECISVAFFSRSSFSLSFHSFCSSIRACINCCVQSETLICYDHIYWRFVRYDTNEKKIAFYQICLLRWKSWQYVKVCCGQSNVSPPLSLHHFIYTLFAFILGHTLHFHSYDIFEKKNSNFFFLLELFQHSFGSELCKKEHY